MAATIGYKCTEMYWGGELGFDTKAVNRKSCCCCWFAAAAAHKREGEREGERCKVLHSYFAGLCTKQARTKCRGENQCKGERNADQGYVRMTALNIAHRHQLW